MSDQKIKALLAEYENAASSHRTGQRVFAYLSAVARNSTSAEESGQLIAEHVSGEGDDINEWIELHRKLTNSVLETWYRAARRHKQQGATK